MKQSTRKLLAINLALVLLFSLWTPVFAAEVLQIGQNIINTPPDVCTEYLFITGEKIWYHFDYSTGFALELYQEDRYLGEASGFYKLSPDTEYRLVGSSAWPGDRILEITTAENAALDTPLAPGSYCFTPESSGLYHITPDAENVNMAIKFREMDRQNTVIWNNNRSLLIAGRNYWLTVPEGAEPATIRYEEVGSIYGDRGSAPEGIYLFTASQSGMYFFDRNAEVYRDGWQTVLLNEDISSTKGKYYELEGGDQFIVSSDKEFSFFRSVGTLPISTGYTDYKSVHQKIKDFTFTPQDSGIYRFHISGDYYYCTPGFLKLYVYENEELIADTDYVHRSSDFFDWGYVYIRCEENVTYDIRTNGMGHRISVTDVTDLTELPEGKAETEKLYRVARGGIYSLTETAKLVSKSLGQLPHLGNLVYLREDQVVMFRDTGAEEEIYYLGTADSPSIDQEAKAAGLYTFTPQYTGIYCFSEGARLWDMETIAAGNGYLLQEGREYVILAENEVQVSLPEEGQETLLEIPGRIRHSLNLSEDISINYAVSTSFLKDYDNSWLEVQVPKYKGNDLVGTETYYIEPVEAEGGYTYYTLSGMTAIQMMDEAEARLHLSKDGEYYVSAVDSYSIGAYAYKLLDNPAASYELRRMCANLLQYGAKAQQYKNYRTNCLADKDMTDEHIGVMTELYTVEMEDNSWIMNDANTQQVLWVGKSLILDRRVAIRYIVDASAYDGSVEELYLQLSYWDIRNQEQVIRCYKAEVYDESKGYYAFTFDGLEAAELRTMISATVYSNRDYKQYAPTLRYSAESYCADKTGILGELCRAMMAYSDSAAALFGK